MLIVDLEDRQASRTAQAWQLLTTHAPGNSGKIRALEYLNREDCSLREDSSIWDNVKNCGWKSLLIRPKFRESLNGVDLSEKTHSSWVYLRGVDLSGADLQDANLSGVDLQDANLSGAKLNSINLKNAFLYKADLSKAVLTGIADLSGADLEGANLSGANLRNTILWDAALKDADLSGADLGEDILGYSTGGAKGLERFTQEQLDEACGDDKTQLPDGFNIRNC